MDCTQSALFFFCIITPTQSALQRPLTDPLKHTFILQLCLVSLPCSSWFSTAEQSTDSPATGSDLRLSSNTTTLLSSSDSLPRLPFCLFFFFKSHISEHVHGNRTIVKSWISILVSAVEFPGDGAQQKQYLLELYCHC